MAYTPLNLQNGQVLTAEDLQHMEQGILDNELPPPANFQQLVTDGIGNVGWANRLAYVDSFEGEYTLIKNKTLTIEDGWGMIYSEYPIFFAEGKTYTVTWDGEEYECVAKTGVGFGDGPFPFIGNPDGNGTEPFCVGTSWRGTCDVWSKNNGEHTISVYGEEGVSIPVTPLYSRGYLDVMVVDDLLMTPYELLVAGSSNFTYGFESNRKTILTHISSYGNDSDNVPYVLFVGFGEPNTSGKIPFFTVKIRADRSVIRSDYEIAYAVPK